MFVGIHNIFYDIAQIKTWFTVNVVINKTLLN